MIRISQLKLKVTHNDKNMNEAVCRALRIKPEMLCGIRIVKRSLDARKKPDIFYSYVVDVKVKDEDKVLHINRSNKD
ncbi:MAG: FAD-dependent oxidoreductase, partial [Lachnospiraceae bacterium]|nr:FAD-dependent oxidoreductase [Lachnospiraceae bacterium]